MDVVQVLVRTQGIHVCVNAAAGRHAQFRELQALPLGQGMHYFRRGVREGFHRELHGAFHAVQIVIEALPGEHHHGRRDAQQYQLGAQVGLEHIFDGLDGLFRLLGTAQQVAVILGNKKHDAKVVISRRVDKKVCTGAIWVSTWQGLGPMAPISLPR